MISYTTGARSAPLVATRYNHQPQSYSLSSTGKRESSAPPAGLTNRDNAVPSPVGADTLIERSRIVKIETSEHFQVVSKWCENEECALVIEI